MHCNHSRSSFSRALHRGRGGSQTIPLIISYADSVECIIDSLQDISLSDEDRKLAAEGECKEVLSEQCPAEYNNVDVKDVRCRVREEGMEQVNMPGCLCRS